MGAAAATARAAGLFRRTTGLMEQRADYAGVIPLQADCTTKRSHGSGPPCQSDARDSEAD